MELFYELDNILSTIERDEYFVDFLNTGSIEAGIIRLREDQRDTQTSHPSDELYIIIEGRGMINIAGEDHPVNRGMVIYVPANRRHRFCGNKDELVVLYIFPRL
jgi:mannose-6-phosphate isomerase-like protein (cupin superfamily)